MRLLPRVAAIWQQASPRFALNLVPFRLLARPVAPIPTTFPHIRCLHDDAKKKPDSALEQAAKDPPDDDQVKLETDNSAADSESAAEHAALEAPGDDTKTTAVRKGKKWGSDAQRAQLRKLIETQRAAGFPNLQKDWESERANGFPKSKQALEASRAAGFPGAKQSLKNQRAAGFPNAKKGLESQRAAGFPNLKKVAEIMRAAGFPSLKKAVEEQRASGWADQKKYHAEQQVSCYLELRSRRHAELLRDIESANQRKLAADPTFIPPPLPDLDSRPRVNYRRRLGTIPCPEPGCNSKLSNERTLAIHIQKMHSCYSIETPHKCEDPGCNQYFPTKKKASKHLFNVHRGPKPLCPVCDRVFSRHATLEQHLLLIHGIQPSPA